MSGKHSKDRRQSYSFKQHFKRALETKGLLRVVTPMIASALIAGAAFAYCSSDSITGPSADAPASAPSGPPGKPQLSAITEKFPVFFTEFPVVFDAAATSCTGDAIDVMESKMNGSGTITITATGGFHLQLHINYSFKGVGMTHTPVRRYVGSQEYNHEINVAGNTVDRWDFQMNVIARGETDPTVLFEGDDFIAHVNVTMHVVDPEGLPPPTVIPEGAHAFTKCK